MAGELTALQTATATQLDLVKHEFVSKLDTVQQFINNYTQYGAVTGAYTNPIDIVISNVDKVNDLLTDIVFHAPTRPAGLDAMQPEKFKTHVFEAWQIEGLENKLMDVVTTSDTGILKELSAVNITEGFQESLYNYQRTNDIRDLEYELDVLDGRWAADGYSLPPDALVHNRSWLVARFDEKRTDRTRNIFSEIAKIAQQNIQWAYENGIKIEELHANFAINYAKIFKDITDAIVAIYKADVEIAIMELESKIKQLQAEIDRAKLNITRDDVEMKLKVDQSNSRLASYISSFNSMMGTNTNAVGHRISAANNVAEGYKAIFNAHGGRYTGIQLETKKTTA